MRLKQTGLDHLGPVRPLYINQITNADVCRVPQTTVQTVT